MNGFEAHGIPRLSPSSLNMAGMQLPFWLLERVYGFKFGAGPAAARGTAIEAGVAHGLMNPTAEVAACQAIALADFDGRHPKAGIFPDPRCEKERAMIAPTVAVALAELRLYGVPSAMQTAIRHEIEGLPPFLGFLDFSWEHHGLIIDLKTSSRMSSEISTSHGRQVAMYLHNTNYSGRLCYATPKAVAVYALDNPAEHMADLVNTAHRLGRFLSISKDRAELAGLLIPDYSHWIWNSPEARAAGKAVYGF